MKRQRWYLLSAAWLLLLCSLGQAQYTPWAVQWLQKANNAESGRRQLGITYTNWFTNANGIVFNQSLDHRAIDLTASTNNWDDLVFPAATLNPPGPAGGGTIVSTSGTSGDQLALRMNNNQVFWVTVQMRHNWNAGSKIYAHVHIEPQTANLNNIVWELKYSIADIGRSFPADTTVGQNNAIPAGNQWKHLLMNIPTAGIAMTTNTGPSTVMRMRYRVVTVDEPIDIVSFDIHFLDGGTVVPYSP